MDLKPISDQLVQLINQAVAILVPALLAWLVATLSRRNKIAEKQVAQVAAKDERDLLNSALRTGAKAVLSVTPNAPIKEMVAGGLDYARKVAPDAFVAADVDGALAQKAHARALEVRQEAGLS